jgi:hypothetical protein
MQIIIISKDQRESIPAFIRALNEQLPTIPRCWVIDKDTDESMPLLLSLNERAIEQRAVKGFAAGACRDLGLSEMGVDDTFFFDGDRIPHGLTLKLVETALNTYDSALMRVERDYRTCFDDYFKPHPHFGKLMNNFFSAALLLRDTLINRIQERQNSHLFHPEFNGAWGEEDRFLGDMVHAVGASCGLFPKSCWVEGGFKRITDWASYHAQQEKREALLKGIKNG